MRLLSPERRRVYPNPQTGVIDLPRPDRRLVSGIRTPSVMTPEPDKATWDALRHAGWTEYDGPADVDAFGYVVPGTDPAVIPATIPARQIRQE